MKHKVIKVLLDLTDKNTLSQTQHDLVYEFDDMNKFNSQLEYWRAHPEWFSNIRSSIVEVDYMCTNPISWDEYFMEIAKLTAKRSKDPNTKVGSCIASDKNKIIGTGYNGVPTGLDETLFPTNRDGELHMNKYGYFVHAEANAIMNSPVFDLSNSRIYCTLFPCNVCSQMIIQKGIKEVIYLEDKHHNDPPYIASRKLLSAANIIVRQYGVTPV